MCGFNDAIRIPLDGSGKDDRGWFDLGKAQVYHDHFVRAQFEGGVVVDLLRPGEDISLQLCFELSAEAARALGQALLDTVAGIGKEAGAELAAAPLPG
ncbi:MAG: hypothetical protein EXR51_07070 [Dehalococcoidia bacterium]|nr:hypothetical protein [Dehalococcoidia bacterium]